MVHAAHTPVSSFARLLRLGGTLAVWFYRLPAFAEPSFAPRYQRLLDEILDGYFGKVIRGGGPAHRLGWKRARECMVRWLDNVVLPAEEWRGRKWNAQLSMPFYGPKASDFEGERTSTVREEEGVWEERDPGFWVERWRVEGVKRFVAVNLPRFGEEKGGKEDEVVEKKYQELEAAMGGKEAERVITWPVILILATRK